MKAQVNPRYLVNKKFVELWHQLVADGAIEEGKHGGKNKSWVAEKLHTKSHILKKYLEQELADGKAEDDRYIPIIRALYFCDLFKIDREEILSTIPRLGVEEAYGKHLEIAHLTGKNLHLLYSNVPLRATPPSDAADDIGDIYEQTEKLNFPGIDREMVGFTVSGDSMDPTFQDGDLIMAEKLETFEEINRNRYYVVQTQKGVYLNQIAKQYNESNKLISFSLISINPAFDPFIVSTEDVRGVYRVRKKVSEV